MGRQGNPEKHSSRSLVYLLVNVLCRLYLHKDCKMMVGIMIVLIGLTIYLPMILFGWYLSWENRLDRIEMSKRIDDLESKIARIKNDTKMP